MKPCYIVVPGNGTTGIVDERPSNRALDLTELLGGATFRFTADEGLRVWNGAKPDQWQAIDRHATIHDMALPSAWISR